MANFFDLYYFPKEDSINECFSEYIHFHSELIAQSANQRIPEIADTPASRADQISHLKQLSSLGYYRASNAHEKGPIFKMPIFLGDLKRCIKWLCLGVFLRLCGEGSSLTTSNPWWGYFVALENRCEFDAQLPDVDDLVSSLHDLLTPWLGSLASLEDANLPMVSNIFEIVAVKPYVWEVYWGPYTRADHVPPICVISITPPAFVRFDTNIGDLFDQIMKFAFFEDYRGSSDFWGLDCRYPCEHCGYESLVPDDTECPNCHTKTKEYEYKLHTPPLFTKPQDDEDDEDEVEVTEDGVMVDPQTNTQ